MRLHVSIPVLVLSTVLLAGCLDDGPAEEEESRSVSPYVAQMASTVRGLSEQEIADLATGAGMGYARPAELNGYPGPLHVLELAEDLALTEAQEDAVRGIRADMLAKAVPLGQRYLELYAELEKRFREGDMDSAAVADHSARLGDLDGELRTVHLSAHLTTRDVLTQHQRFEYDRLRGYAEGEMDHGAHGMDH